MTEHWATRLYNYAADCERAHRGTFDGWVWMRIELAAAYLSDWLDPTWQK